MNESIVIRLESMPLNENIEQSHCIGQTAFEIGPNTMDDFLEMADCSKHRQDRFDQHPGVPLTAFAQFEVSGIPILLSETFIAQYHHPVGNAINQFLKGGAIIDISRVASPLDDQTEMVDQQAQFSAHNPTPVRLAFLANLLLAAAFTSRVDQFDAIAVNQPDQRGFRHEQSCPASMDVEQAKQARPVGKMWKQMSPIARQPAVVSSIAHSLQREPTFSARGLTRRSSISPA